MGRKQNSSALACSKSVLLSGSIALICLHILAARAIDLNDPYLPFAIAGGAVFYLRVTSSVREKLIWITSSACLAAFMHFPRTDWITGTSSFLVIFGFGAFLMLTLRVLWSATDTRRKALAALAPAAAVVFFVFSAQRALSLANLLFPKTYDLYLFVFDGSLGFQPSFIAGQIMARSHLLAVAAIVTYLSLPFFMSVVYALRLPRDAESPSWDIITLLMLAGMGGYLLYIVVPATGPAFVFKGSFPMNPLPFHLLPKLALERIAVADDVPRNAIPSLHMAWVLLLYWNSRALSASFRVLAGVYVALTVVATLGTGQHYLIDLVASMPFALLIQAIVSPEKIASVRLRVTVAGIGLALTLGWLMLVRYATKFMLVSPVIPWGLIVVSCGIVLVLKNRLFSGSERVPKEDSSAKDSTSPLERLAERTGRS
jgi:hypothetical protein